MVLTKITNDPAFILEFVFGHDIVASVFTLELSIGAYVINNGVESPFDEFDRSLWLLNNEIGTGLSVIVIFSDVIEIDAESSFV